MERRVKVVGVRRVRNSPRPRKKRALGGPWVVLVDERVADVAAPGDVGLYLRDALDEPASPHRLETALAAAYRDEVLSVPLGARLQVVEGAHRAQRHVVEVRVCRVGIVRRLERIGLARRILASVVDCVLEIQVV